MSNGDANKCKFINNFVLSSLVYLVLVSLAIVSFEFSPMSNDLTDEFSLIDIFFIELQVIDHFVFVCYYVQEGMCSSFWFFFVATCKDATT